MNQLSFDLNRYFFLCRSYQIVLKDPYDEADKLNSCDLKYKDQQLEKIADEFFVFFGLLKLSPNLFRQGMIKRIERIRNRF